MVLNLLNAGVYDDSFVDILGGRFSAQTLKTFAAKNNAVLKAASSGSSSGVSTSKYSDSDWDTLVEKISKKNSKINLGDTDLSYDEIKEYAERNNYGKTFSDDRWQEEAGTFGISVNGLKAMMKMFQNK